jgi:hypothetical protein
MKVECTSKSAVETGSKNDKSMSLMIYFVFLGPDGNACSSPFFSLATKEDFDRYQVGEVYEIK